VSYAEPVALRGQNGFGASCARSRNGIDSSAEAGFIERLKRGEAAAFEEWVADRSGEIYGLLFA